MNAKDLAIVRYCAEEVERQQDSPTAVFYMVFAWKRAMEEQAKGRSLDVGLIEEIGCYVHPGKNSAFRRVGVRVGLRVCPHPSLVPRLVENFVAGLDTRTPEESYREFQEIHPFVDGNGRTGKILYNWLKGTLASPQMPPNFWGISNP